MRVSGRQRRRFSNVTPFTIAPWLVALAFSAAIGIWSPRSLTVYTQAPGPRTARDPVISSAAVGPVRLGMTLDEVRSAFPIASLARTTDGEGAALVELTLAPRHVMTLWAGEDEPAAPIDWSRKIATIETFSAVFHTPEGIHPGSTVDDAQKVYGKVKEIEKSEIEGRQYITFEQQPPGLTFRIDYTGIFPAGSRTTTRFQQGASIYSIAISCVGEPSC